MNILNKRSYKKQNSESGSIMLEVVAVLALMGVMGAMLFRQIYQRNQELQNIQMASEIRTVKEAFAAYIQANRSSLIEGCLVGTATAGEVYKCPGADSATVAQYLPDGWFTDGALGDYYTLQMFGYIQDDVTRRQVIYGVVVPTTGTLPSTGWNFRRAARVALLIGADGGAYDTGITPGYVAGSMGSWQLPVGAGAAEIVLPSGVSSIYVATTGLDVFNPDYEMPEGDVKLPENFSLALNNLHAYGYFSVGNAAGGEGCYIINHNNYDPTTSKVKNDTITPNSSTCKPLFWVGAQDGNPNAQAGNVYVATDFNVGKHNTDGTHNEALKITSEGVIKQKKGLVIDGAGRIISRDIVHTAGAGKLGDLEDTEHYVLDPGRVSTMMDIRLASRGGVRLSDILPNYILKDQFEVNCSFSSLGKHSTFKGALNTTPATFTEDVSWCDAAYTAGFGSTTTKDFPLPNCPTGYQRAVVVSPSYFGGGAVKKKGHTHSVPGTNTGNAVYNDAGDKFITDVCQAFAVVNIGQTTHPLGALITDDSTKTTFRVVLGYREMGSVNVTGVGQLSYVCKDASYSGVVQHAVVQTYCVWSPSLYDCLTTDSTAECTKKSKLCLGAGYLWNEGSRKCTTHMIDPNWDLKANGESEPICTAYGFTWDTTSGKERCIFKYVSASDINNTSKVNKPFKILEEDINQEESADQVLTRRAAVCKAAGYKWNQCSSTSGCCYSGTVCSCS